MRKFVICGHEPNFDQNIIVRVSVEQTNDIFNDLIKAKELILNCNDDRIKDMNMDYIFEGNPDEFTGDPESFELKED